MEELPLTSIRRERLTIRQTPDSSLFFRELVHMAKNTIIGYNTTILAHEYLANEYLTNEYLTNEYLTNEYLTNEYLTNEYLTGTETNPSTMLKRTATHTG